MGFFEKKAFVKIDETDLKDAKMSSGFVDEKTQKRAFMDVLGARLAIKMLFSKKLEANNVYSLYTIQSVLRDFDVADIYFEGIKIDVRLVFNKDTIFIPKSHFNSNLLPDVYFVMELKKDFSGAEFIGFFEPKGLNKENQNNEFYFYEYDKLQGPDELKKFLKKFDVKETEPSSDEELQKAQELFLSMVDDDISSEDKEFLFKQLANNFILRENFVEFENFEVISTHVAKDEEILNDNVLDIVGAQKIFEDENKDLSQAEIKSEIIEEVLSELIEPEEDFEQPQEEFQEEIYDDETSAQLEDDDFLEELIDKQESELEPEQEEEKPLEQEDKELELDSNSEQDQEQEQPESETETEPQAVEEFLEEVVQEEELKEDIVYQKEDESNFAKASSDKEEETINEELDLQNELPKDISLDNLPDLEFNTDFEENIPEYLKTLSNQEENIEKIEETEKEIQDEQQTNDFDMDFESNIDQEEPAYLKELQNNQETIEDTLQEVEPDSEQEPERDIEAEQKLIEETEKLFEEEGQEDFWENLENKNIEENNLSDEEDFSLDDFDFDLLKDDEIEIVEHKQDLFNVPEQEEELQLNELVEDTSSEPGQPEKSFVQEEEVVSSSQNLADETVSSDEKDPLQYLFQEKSDINLPQEDENLAKEKTSFPGQKVASSERNKKKVIIAASVASVVIISFVAGGIVSEKNNKLMNNMPGIENVLKVPKEISQTALNSNLEQQKLPPNFEQQVIPGENQQEQLDRDMGKAVSDAFLSEPVNANISKIAWEVPEDAAYNDGFRKYLQTAGKNLKLNLQNDLLLSNEMAYSNKIVINLDISKDGSLLSSNIVTSSGSKQIDRIVLQSVKDTLKYLKIPANELNSNSVGVSLIINF